MCFWMFWNFPRKELQTIFVTMLRVFPILKYFRSCKVMIVDSIVAVHLSNPETMIAFNLSLASPKETRLKCQVLPPTLRVNTFNQFSIHYFRHYVRVYVYILLTIVLTNISYSRLHTLPTAVNFVLLLLLIRNINANSYNFITYNNYSTQVSFTLITTQRT